MKLIVALPTENKQICAHFGHCEEFAFVTTEDGKITNIEWVTPPEHVPGLYPKFVAEKGANIVIAGGMGMQAQELFKQNNVDVYYGVETDSPENIVNTYLKGELVAGKNLCDH
ncbi:NifB/NifX family molybdenum-iron cluster-binding protein [bacterium]|nr:NifB/NifX family molybdenum-iron cluster-binding protein [bacterium]